MCVRTKTSYGCGCEYKTDSKCNSPDCAGLERYHYPKSGDCRSCKEAGGALSRGRDGKGRYGQEISKRSQHRQKEVESPSEPSVDAEDIGNGISPWAPPLPREKEWSSHSRRKADDLWLREHAERNIDLQSILESLPSYSDRGSPASRSPPRREARVYVHEDDLAYEREDTHHRRHRQQDLGRSLPVEIRSGREEYDQGHHRVYRRRRQDSQDSFESTPSSRSSTRKYVRAPASYATHEYIEHHDSGYGSYGSHVSHGFGGAKTEPHHYSPSSAARIVTMKPVSPPSYGGYHTGYAMGPINPVTRAPAYGYVTRGY